MMAFPPRLQTHLAVPRILELFLLVGICLIPIITVFAPRFLAFMPALLAVCGLILFQIAYRKWPAFSKRSFLWILAVCGLCFLSGFWAVGGFATTFTRALRITMVLFSGFGLWSLVRALSAQNLFHKQFMIFFPLTFMIATALCLLDLYGNGILYFLFHEYRAEPLNLSRINRTVIALTFMAFPAIWALWNGPCRKKTKYVLGGLSILTLGAIFYKTDSQSAQMALGVGALFFGLFPTRVKVLWSALIALLASGMALAPWIAQYLFTFLAGSAQNMIWLSRGYATNRMEIWNFISYKILQNPLYGFGLEATRDIPRFDTQKLYTPMDHVLHPHNFVLQIWIEFGVIGLILSIGLLRFMLTSIQKQPPEIQRLGLAVFMAVFCASAMAYGLWQGWWLGLFTVLIIVCVALEKSVCEKKTDERASL